MSGCHRPICLGLVFDKKTWQEKIAEEMEEGKAVARGERLKGQRETWSNGVCGPEEPHTID